MGSKLHNKVEKIDNISCKEKKSLIDLLMKYNKMFSRRHGLISTYEHKITVNDRTQYCEKGWPLKHRVAIEMKIQCLLTSGVTAQEVSPFINRKVPVIKKNGTVRLCLDGRTINQHTTPDYESSLPI